jgi:drug/metabolite transporter (DMT)-like permease
MTEHHHHPREHHGFMFGIAAALVSAALATITKLAIDVPNETIVFFRFAVGLPFIWAIAASKGVHFSFRQVPKHLIRGFAGFASLYFYVSAIKLIPVVNAITLSNTIPLFMPFIVMIWLRELVSKWRFVATAIGFLGVVILLRPTAGFLQLGSLYGLANGLCGAIALMGVRLLSKNESTEKILFYYFLLSTILAVYPMLVTWKEVSLLDWGYLFAIGALSTIYQYLLTMSYTHAPATKASMTGYLAVIFGGIAGWMVFNEVPDVWVWVGSFIIVASAIFALLDKTPSKKF